MPKKRKNFFNDEDGFTKDDLEKLLLLILTVLCVAVALVVYILKGDITPNMVYLVSAILTATVARKGLSYLKPDRYYGNDVSADKIKANNPEVNPYGSMYGMNYASYTQPEQSVQEGQVTEY